MMGLGPILPALTAGPPGSRVTGPRYTDLEQRHIGCDVVRKRVKPEQGGSRVSSLNMSVSPPSEGKSQIGPNQDM